MSEKLSYGLLIFTARVTTYLFYRPMASVIMDSSVISVYLKGSGVQTKLIRCTFTAINETLGRK